MIEFDESEHLESDFTDRALQLILIFCGPDVKDALLLPGAVEIHGDITNESG